MNRIFATTAALCAVLVLAGCYSRIMPEPPQTRQGVLPVAGASNIRDMGGLAGHEGRAVKWGLLVRSGELDMLSARDRSFLFDPGGMGIGTVVDFRCGEPLLRFGPGGDGLDVVAVSERTGAPGRIPDGVLWTGNTGISESVVMGDFEGIIRNPNMYFDDVVRDVAERYRGLVTVYRERYLEFFRALLAARGTPVLFHCSSGRDRTGVAAALLLLALGVSEADIVANYMLSLEFVRQRYFSVEPTVTSMINRARFAALRLTDNDAGDDAVAAIEAELRAAAAQRVRRNFMQNRFSQIMAEGSGMSPDHAVDLAREYTRNQNLDGDIDTAFERAGDEMRKLGEMEEADFDEFVRNAGRKITPLTSVFDQWIMAALDAAGDIEVFLDDVDTEMSGAEVVNLLREWFLEPADNAENLEG